MNPRLFIVFLEKKPRLVKNLQLNNFSARAYHAGLDKKERK